MGVFSSTLSKGSQPIKKQPPSHFSLFKSLRHSLKKLTE
ncbi:hypothetical protein RV11_GL000285 [Enterococcus phoeniculicola]|nr:hypothetical protein RV11_GL000285 [Enterococcus phoeniculicola]